MKTQVRNLSTLDMVNLIAKEVEEEDRLRLSECLLLSKDVQVGKADGKLVCIWGLVPPTLMSNRAYLWLYVHERVGEYQFLFIRHSQLAVQAMLEDYEELYGNTDPQNRKAVRWLKWLGAEFERNGKLLDFKIRKK